VKYRPALTFERGRKKERELIKVFEIGEQRIFRKFDPNKKSD
jgi:hypothetical protein